MPDLICLIPNHGYSESTFVFVSWLNDRFYVRDEDTDSFKISSTDDDLNFVQFTETITDGFVREVSEIGATTIGGLEHLEGELVAVTSDGMVVASSTVANGSITITNDVFTYAVGKTYTATLVPMDIDLEGLGLAATTRINKTFVNIHETIGGKIGPDVNHLEDIVTGNSLFTGFKEVPIPGGYKRDTDITIQQTQPLPMTTLGLTHDIGGSKD
jgi:hypothetical protein